jgi:PAS domain S-box-containing protein
VPRPFLSGLRGRLLLLVALATLPAFALSWYTGWESRQRQLAAVSSDTVALASRVASDQEVVIDLTRQILSDLAAMPEVRAGEPHGSSAIFSILMKQYRGYASLMVLDPAGSILVSQPPAAHPVNFSDRLWFNQALTTCRFALGDYQVGQLTGKSVVSAAWPVVDDTGRVVSVIAAGLDVTWLNQVAATAQLPPGAVLVLVDRQGVVVARYPATAGVLGRGLPERALVARMQQQSQGTIELADEDGSSRIWAFAPVGGGGSTALRMAVGVPKSVAYGAVDRLQTRSLLALLLVMALTLTAAWFAAERFVLRSVASLIEATRKLAAGEQGARTALPYGQSELSELARSFDEMASALESRQAERDRAEQALRRSEERFRAFMDNSPAIAFVRAAGGEVIYANAALERAFGLEPGRWRGEPDSRFWSPELAERFARGEVQALEKGEPIHAVGPVVLADGRERYWLTVTFPLTDPDGRTLAATMAVDMTEWRQARDQLALAERRYTQLVEHASDAIVITDSTLRLVDVNTATCRMSGYTREELLGRGVADLVAPDELAARPLELDGLRSGQNVVVERKVRRKDGTFFVAEVNARAFEGDGVQAIVRDVSARYEAEQAVRQSEERFRLLYQYLPIAYQSLSEHGTIVMVNDAWLTLTGLTRGQAVGRRFVDLLASGSVDVYESRFRRAILSGDVHDVELTLVRGDRARVTVSIDGRRGQNEHGELRVHCALHDVTAARQADARLRVSEERYRTLFDESPVSMWEEDFSGIRRHLDRLRALGVADFETHFVAHPEELDDCIGAVTVVDVNRATLALYGADSRSQLLAGLDRIIGEDGRDVFRRSIVALAGGARTWCDEGLNYTLGNQPIRLALRWSVAPGSERTWSRVLVSAVDITDRARVEDALQESEARFERVFHSTPTLAAISRRSDGTLLDVNDVFLREMGFTRGEVVGRTWGELGVGLSPDKYAELQELVDRQGAVHGQVIRWRRRSGTPFEGMLSVVALRVEGVECLLGQAIDTTARRRDGEAARESQRRLAGVLSDLPGMAYQCCVDPEWTMLSVSDGCRALTGYEPPDLIGNRVVSYGSLIVEDDREMVFATIRDAIERGEPFRLAYRIRHASGDVRWVWEQGRVAESLLDQATMLEGLIFDITDRHRSDAARHPGVTPWRDG